MRNDEFMNFGEEISRSVRRVLNSKEISDLKHMINDTVQSIPGMEGARVFQTRPPYWDDGIRLSKEEEEAPGHPYGAFGAETAGGAYGAGAGAGVRRSAAGDWNWNGGGQGQAAGGRRKPRRRGALAGTLMLVFGLVGLIPNALVFLLGLIVTIAASDAEGWSVVAFFAVLTAGFTVLTCAGVSKRKRWKRFQLYQRVLGGRAFCEVRELSAASGRKPEAVRRDLKKMIAAGLFQEGYLDNQGACFMTDYETYNQYLTALENAKKRELAEEQERQKWASHPDGAALRQTVAEGRAYVQRIKAANDALPEEEISEKLDQLEEVTSRIFAYVEQHPEKLPEIRRLMSYYMPITLKLVGAYQAFEINGAAAGTDVSAAKLEIKGTLDTINRAYQNLLQKLMKADVWDISSDISALETILAQEGLTD